ncbi:MAG: hypothetical protein K6E78_06570 [Treponema sp.]|nr:hypothetical protein [Treponema sp.]
MYTEEESDFWKEKLNLMRIQNLRLSSKAAENLEEKRLVKTETGEAEEKLREIQEGFSSMECQIEKTDSSFSWEISPSPSLKIRGYHQKCGEIIASSAKISILGKTDRTWEKIADARFPNDPFILISHFLSHFETYQVELEEIKKNTLKYQKKQEIAYRTITALLSEKYEKSSLVWSLIKNKKDFTLCLTEKDQKRNISLTLENFMTEIDALPL